MSEFVDRDDIEDMNRAHQVPTIDVRKARILVGRARRLVDEYRDAPVGDAERAAGILLAGVTEDLARLAELALDAARKADSNTRLLPTCRSVLAILAGGVMSEAQGRLVDALQAVIREEEQANATDCARPARRPQ